MKSITKQFSRDVTDRFLKATADILLRETKTVYCEKVGITATTLDRLKRSPANFCTLEQLGNIINEYGISGTWLLFGTGEMIGNDQLPGTMNLIDSRLQQISKAMHDINAALKTVKVSGRNSRKTLSVKKMVSKK